MPDWLITGCSQLLTLRGPVPRRGRALAELGIIQDGALLVHDDRIVAIGTRRKVESARKARRAEKLDLGGRVVLPGFVDSHTHLIFPASRAAEYEQRISGATYEEIARKRRRDPFERETLAARTRKRIEDAAPWPISRILLPTERQRSKRRAVTAWIGRAS